jgi:hypothetical protein
MLIDKIHRSVAGMAISEPFAASTIKPLDWAADASARVADAHDRQRLSWLAIPHDEFPLLWCHGVIHLPFL